MLTVSGNGMGAARLQDASQGYQEVLSTRSTNPGNFLVFYGSGVGAVTGDETIQQVQTNLTNIPVTVTIGGKPAQVFYRGRTIFPGLDQINVQVPVLDPGRYGCAVPVVIITDGVPANATTIPVAESGSNCSTGSVSGGPVSGATQQEIDAWTAAGSFTSGNIRLTRTTLLSVADSLPGTTGGTTIINSDAFAASFDRISGMDLGRYLAGEGTAPALGSCLVHDNTPFAALTYAALDAGPSITASGPAGALVAARNGLAYQAQVSGQWVNTGQYNVSGPGGPGVGAFTGGLEVPANFTVLNPEDFRTINRGAGVTARWTGGDPSVPVQISGTSVTLNSDGTQGTPISFVCSANSADQQFTVPANILQQLPATSSVAGPIFPLLLRGSFSVTASGKGARITASGLDYLKANNSSTWKVTTEYR
jgi:hypothetical protein